MWRRLLWWSAERPAVLPWAVILSLVLLLLGHDARLAISGTVVRFVYAPFFALRYRIAAGADVFEENRRLIEQVATLQIDNQRLREAEHENQRLRRLLDFPPLWEGELVAAEVVGPLSPGSGSLWIVTADREGVAEGRPVTTEDGLLGRVVGSSGSLSHVRTLWDQLLRVAAYDERSRVGGVIRWRGGANLHLEYVDLRADIRVGDTILSSGWGGVFPKGLMIGAVTALDSLTDDEFLDVIVEPAVQPNRLEAVFVIEPVDDSVANSGEVDR